MFTKVVAGVLAASALLVTLHLLGVTADLRSPLLLGYLCGVLALAASVVALLGEGERRDERRISASPAAPRPRLPNM